MRFEITTDVDATPEALWRAVIDVVEWPKWTKSITLVSWMKGAELAEGAQVRIKQPRLGASVWTVTEWLPGRSFTWQTVRPGVRIVGTHAVTASDGGRARLTLGIQQAGPASGLASLLTARLARRYVQMESNGLKRCAETAG